jgi:hypothetical protein
MTVIRRFNDRTLKILNRVVGGYRSLRQLFEDDDPVYKAAIISAVPQGGLQLVLIWYNGATRRLRPRDNSMHREETTDHCAVNNNIPRPNGPIVDNTSWARQEF